MRVGSRGPARADVSNGSVGRDQSLGRRCGRHGQGPTGNHGRYVMAPPLLVEHNSGEPVTMMYVSGTAKSGRYDRTEGGDPGLLIGRGQNNSLVRPVNAREVGRGSGTTAMYTTGDNRGIIGKAGGVVVNAPANRAIGIRTPQQTQRPPPTPLAFVSGMPLNVPGCRGCTESSRARLDEPVLFLEDRHAAGVFSEAQIEEEDDDNEVDYFDRFDGLGETESKASATAFWQQQLQAAGAGIEIHSEACGSSSIDGRQPISSWRIKERTKTLNVGLIMCLKLGERVVPFAC